MGNYKISSKAYIKNLTSFISNPISVSKDFIVEYTYSILHAMAELTIQDTNQARYLLISKFAEKYGYAYNDLNTHYYNYWGNAEREDRGWGNNQDKSSLSESSSNKNYQVNISVEDDGLFNQELGLENYPSKIHAEHTGRNNEKYKTSHISFITDKVNSGDFGSIENFNYSKLVEVLVTDIEMFLFTGR